MIDPRVAAILIAGFLAAWWTLIVILARMEPALRYGYVGTPYRVVRFAYRLIFRRRPRRSAR